MQRECALPTLARRILEEETGASVHVYSGAMARLDPRFAHLLVATECSALVVCDRVVKPEHANIVCEPEDHTGLPQRKILFVHSWAEVPELESIEIRRIDDETCPHPPVTDPDWDAIGARRAAAYNFAGTLALLAAASVCEILRGPRLLSFALAILSAVLGIPTIAALWRARKGRSN